MYQSLAEWQRSLTQPTEGAGNSQSIDTQQYIVQAMGETEEVNTDYPYWNIGIVLTLAEIELGRSFLWAWQTEKDSNFFEGMTGEFLGCTLTQMICTLPVVLSMAIINVLVQRKYFSVSERHNREWLKEQLVIALSSWTAIPAWNGAQVLGVYAGSQFLSPLGAGYFSGVFTGVAEDIWQNAFIPLLLRRSINKPLLMLSVLTGAIWMWVYKAVSDNDSTHDYGALTAIAVSLSVAITTLAIGFSLLARCSIKEVMPKADIVVLDEPEISVRPTRKANKYSITTHSITKSRGFNPSSDVEVGSINSYSPSSDRKLF